MRVQKVDKDVFVATPGTGDAQLLFHLHGLAKLEENGRAAIISNGSPLFSGGTSSGESQIRRYILENDLLEAIIALPGQFFLQYRDWDLYLDLQ